MVEKRQSMVPPGRTFSSVTGGIQYAGTLLTRPPSTHFVNTYMGLLGFFVGNCEESGVVHPNSPGAADEMADWTFKIPSPGESIYFEALCGENQMLRILVATTKPDANRASLLSYEISFGTALNPRELDDAVHLPFNIPMNPINDAATLQSLETLTKGLQQAQGQIGSLLKQQASMETKFEALRQEHLEFKVAALRLVESFMGQAGVNWEDVEKP